MKSMPKQLILKRNNGAANVLNELKALLLLSPCKYICNIHYAFQDTAFLYLVTDLGDAGDLRYNLKSRLNERFPEDIVKHFVCQLVIAVNFCHHHSVLHRGMDFLLHK